MIELTSFGYRYLNLPEADLLLDCRNMANPHGSPRLRELDGTHPDVQAFVRHDRRFPSTLKAGREAVNQGRTRIAYGCHGGRHRSVAMVEALAAALIAAGYPVRVKHQSLGTSWTTKPEGACAC